MPGPGAPREEVVGRALEMITNTAPFDITHHPAMAVPCGMFTFPVSVMVLVMVVLGGVGSIRGVVLAALFVAFLQSVILQDLTQYVHALGRLVGSPFLQRIELITSLELIFGIILVVMLIGHPFLLAEIDQNRAQRSTREHATRVVACDGPAPICADVDGVH